MMRRHAVSPDAAGYHTSHRHLLDHISVPSTATARIDAVVVPALRPADCLHEAMRLSRSLGCTLVVLCSGAARSHDVVELADRFGVRTLAIDVTDGIDVLPRLSAREVLVAADVHDRDSDVSAKRNLALLLARMLGWERLAFLDDDIREVESSHVRAAAGLAASGYTAVALENTGFADNSVVCHAHRAVGGDQDQFVGAGALVVSLRVTRSHFPDIYNEDWLYFLGDGAPPRIAVVGSMSQREYDPFGDPERAREEEFGDCVAGGLYRLVDQRIPLHRADRDYWGRFLALRVRFVESLIDRAETLTSTTPNAERWLASLRAAREVAVAIEPGACADYIDAWWGDVDLWRRFIADAPTGTDTTKALRRLGLAERTLRT